MLILTAFNSQYSEIGSLCVESLMRYCRERPEYRFVSHMIPDNYERPASWWKVGAIRRHLPDHDFVLWIDCDAMLVGDGDLMTLIDHDATINIARDENGWNNGVTCWRRCDEAFETLDHLEAGYEKHKDGPWFEQHVLMELEGKITVFEQPKTIWNAYPEEIRGGDLTEQTAIIHFPGMGDDRLAAMRRVKNGDPYIVPIVDNPVDEEQREAITQVENKPEEKAREPSIKRETQPEEAT